LVEGFRSEDFPRLEIFRPSLGKPPLWPEHRGIVAVATDAAALDGYSGPLLNLNDPPAIAAWIVAFTSCGTACA
jgi:molybdopterin-guanine dinucleotide biosynthesis protein